MVPPGARTLADLGIGSGAVITHSHAAEPRLGRRLAELGLRPGAEIRLLMRTAGGGRMIAVDQARVVVGRELLGQVEVEPAGESHGEPR